MSGAGDSPSGLQQQPPALSEPSCSTQQPKNPPVVSLLIGMAGAGKTSLIRQMNSYMSRQNMNGYLINLDPAVMNLPYEPHIDIRDTVNYKNVMSEYKLGPNGGILTACNLFATRFDQVINLIEKPRDPPLENIIVDTPGQIEIFTWSASGNIVTELLASSYPTNVIYVVDTPRCMNPQTFMSNMMQACSILYKTQLPITLAFNKTDIADHSFALEWMKDFEKFQNALDQDSTYASSLSRSLSMVLDEFYTNLKTVGVSAITGSGMEELFQAIRAGAVEYEEVYKPDLDRRKAEHKDRELRRQAADMEKMKADIASGQSEVEVVVPGASNVEDAQ